ncbi:hypothetical protein [Acidisoma silvae]|uniref:Uncharacterized protein n=1 Tax=Acidisoma silvae TaxID=2802396 RepID=A0A963YMN3_9PROT|nr:hypothetical protein [Acidisoma silvae]MCB8873568.1 hypothetical protein [Acidisoma silvae]
MPSQKLNIDQPTEAIDAAEARMRLALGLTGSGRPATAGLSGGPQNHTPQQNAPHDGSRPQRRRFAQDGDVPVVMLNRGRETENGGENRVQTLTSELRDERNNRQRAERALDEANLNIQSLKTKVAHAEMAFEERLRVEREARGKIEVLRIADQEARQQAERREAEAALALSVLERRVSDLEAETAAARSALAVATQAAVPKTDLFGDLTPDAPVRRAGRARKPVVLDAEDDAGFEAEPDIEPDLPPARPPKLSAKAAAKAALAAAAAEKPVDKRAAKKAAIDADDAEAPEDDQPIEWWLPSFRATRTASTTRRRKVG